MYLKPVKNYQHRQMPQFFDPSWGFVKFTSVSAGQPYVHTMVLSIPEQYQMSLISVIPEFFHSLSATGSLIKNGTPQEKIRKYYEQEDF